MGIIEGLKSLEYIKKRKLRKVEKVNLAGCKRGILKMAGRAEVMGPDSFFSMKKVYEEGYNEKNKQKEQIKELFVFFAHMFV